MVDINIVLFVVDYDIRMDKSKGLLQERSCDGYKVLGSICNYGFDSFADIEQDGIG